MASTPPAPTRTTLEQRKKWKHYSLFKRIKGSIRALPNFFQTETLIAGIGVTDLHTLASALGASIEDQVVDTLNHMRQTWDPDGEYSAYNFTRQSQTFPDVVFCKTGVGAVAQREPILGIELKGWFMLAKEGEPNLRYRVNAAACNPWDLVVVVPWALSRVISGRPEVFSPYIEYARFAAEHRNHWWQYIRENRGSNPGVKLATGAAPFPTKGDRIDDEPYADSGGNFGRLARTGIMDTYLGEIRALRLCGIHAQHWVTFFRAFTEHKTNEDIKKALKSLGAEIGKELQADNPVKAPAEAILKSLKDLVSAVEA